MLKALDDLESTGLDELAAVTDAEALEQWRVCYLGTKGRLKALMPRMKTVAGEDKPAVGRRLNEVKRALELAFEGRSGTLAGPAVAAGPIDVTEPGFPMGTGRRHALSRTIDEVTDVFGRMGFSVVQGPEAEDEWHNFDALIIPRGHPARDPRVNFFY